MCKKSSTFAANLRKESLRADIYGTTFIVFIRRDGDQFPVFRTGIGADVHIAELYQFA